MAEPASPEDAGRYARTLAAEQAAVTRADIDARTPAAPATRPAPSNRLLLALAQPPWISDANCRGLDAALFHPERAHQKDASDAKKVCAGCTVRAQCLQFALETNQEHGIWGGMSERERRRIRYQLPRIVRCERCGNQFMKTHGRQRYCPSDCPGLARRAAARTAAWPEKRRTRRGAA